MATWRWLFVLSGLFAALASSQTSHFHEREILVTPSPAETRKITLAPGETVVDFDVWPNRPETVNVVRDGEGKFTIRSWKIGSSEMPLIFRFAPDFEPRSIACHPAEDKFFVLGRSGAQSSILAFESKGDTWQPHAVFQTRDDVRRLLVTPRPYTMGFGGEHARRLVFARRQASGTFSIRTVSESGQREYQIIGPESSYVKFPKGEAGPTLLAAASALPVSFHPAGNILIWQDNRGCFQQLTYEGDNWDKIATIPGNPCGGSLTVTPNGAALLHWRRGQPGVTLISERGQSRNSQAAEYNFISTPSSVPDGRGIVGLVESGGVQTVVYTPISAPLADVINAWMFTENSADIRLLSENSGLFRTIGGDQLHSLYDSENYNCGGYSSNTPTRPYFVTTDILWELVAAAYEGMFIVQERRQAIPAFWEFVNAAHAAMQSKSLRSPWTAAFAAVSAVGSGKTASNAEAARIAAATGAGPSVSFGRNFNFGELRPRGHYLSGPEMAAYFKAVHYLTALAAPGGRETTELSGLPADVRAKALAWTSVYQNYIAPSRAPLIWNPQASASPFARHPLAEPQIFPLSWGFDNEALLSTVYHKDWPLEQQIQGPRGFRLLASGIDLAAVLGSGLARSLLKDAIADYPTLGPVLDALSARKPGRTPGNLPSGSLYDAWIGSLATQWADEVSFPGIPSESRLWKAKRLQTGLASWATLRHATVLVNERTQAECGESGFEEIVLRPPRGYVEPDPKTFGAIAELFDRMAKALDGGAFQQGFVPPQGEDPTSVPLREGIRRRLNESAAKARLFETIAGKELQGQELTEREYEEILYVGRAAEHNFLVFKSLAKKDLALSNPDPMMKVVDVAGGDTLGFVEAAVGRPLEWDQIVPYYGRREIVKGSAYSYYEFISQAPLNDNDWRKRVDKEARPKWIAPFISGSKLSCPAKAPF